MKIELIDAFEEIEIELPAALRDWFIFEAASKKMTVEALLSTKTAGLTVAQLAAARAKLGDEKLPGYVLGWITRQRHDAVAADGIQSAPTEAMMAAAATIGGVVCAKCKAAYVVSDTHECPVIDS